MTKEEFLNKVNNGRYPQYSSNQVQEGNPGKEGVYIIGTAKGGIYLGIWHSTYWNYAGFTTTEFGERQIPVEDTLNDDKVLYYLE